MGRLLKRLVTLAIVGFVAYRVLATLGIIGAEDEAIEFDWDDD